MGFHSFHQPLVVNCCSGNGAPSLDPMNLRFVTRAALSFRYLLFRVLLVEFMLNYAGLISYLMANESWLFHDIVPLR